MACVLVIDDYEPFRRTMEFCLPRFGHTVLTAGEVRTAVRLGASHEVDVVLLDPGRWWTSGLAACRELRRDANLAHVPIIMLAANPTAEAQWQAWMARVVGIVPKPFRWPDLLGVLARHGVAVARTGDGGQDMAAAQCGRSPGWQMAAGGLHLGKEVNMHETITRLEEKVAYLERHVVEQDKAMLELAEDIARLRRELGAVRERAADLARELAVDEPSDEPPPHY